jgi:four helix bundle protein
MKQIVALDHLERAMESIGVNLIRANGQPSGSSQRASYLDVSVASAHECAAALDVCLARRVMKECAYTTGTHKLWRIRGMLLGLKRASVAQVREERSPYGTPTFPFATLDMYQLSLEGVRWTNDFLDELTPRVRVQRRLDTSTTGTVLNIAEGHGRETVDDQNRFMKTAQEHAYQTLLMLDLMAAKNEATKFRIAEGNATQARVITMLHAWCARNQKRNDQKECNRSTRTATRTDYEEASANRSPLSSPLSSTETTRKRGILPQGCLLGYP